MRCPVDANGYCERHKVHHVGRLLELSQMENDLGERYRRLWDQQAGIPPEEVKPEGDTKSSPERHADGAPIRGRNCDCGKPRGRLY